jgi:hypothetical protein
MFHILILTHFTLKMVAICASETCKNTRRHSPENNRHKNESLLGYGAVQSRRRSLLIALVMEAVRTSETSVYFKEAARRYIPDGCHHYSPP